MMLVSKPKRQVSQYTLPESSYGTASFLATVVAATMDTTTNSSGNPSFVMLIITIQYSLSSSSYSVVLQFMSSSLGNHSAGRCSDI